MGKTVLEQVLEAKIAKEQAAARELHRAYNTLEACLNRLKQAQDALTEYVAWRTQEEQTLYQALEGQVVRLTKLEYVNEKVAKLRAKDIELEQTIQEEQNHKQTAEEAVETARVARLAAVKAVEKFTHLCSHEREALDQEQQRTEEWELEELHRVKK